MDISTAIAALTSKLKAAIQIGDYLQQRRIDAAVASKVLEQSQILTEAMRHVLDLQAELGAAQARIRELEEENAALKAEKARMRQFDEKEKELYARREISQGAFVQVLKQPVEGGDAPCWLCQRCFDEKIKSVLQLAKHSVGGKIYVCHRCTAEILVAYASEEITIGGIASTRAPMDDYLG